MVPKEYGATALCKEARIQSLDYSPMLRDALQRKSHMANNAVMISDLSDIELDAVAAGTSSPRYNNNNNNNNNNKNVNVNQNANNNQNNNANNSFQAGQGGSQSNSNSATVSV